MRYRTILCVVVSAVLAWCVPMTAGAQLKKMNDADMSKVAAQGGIYLSGDITLNENGGPIQNAYFGACTDTTKHCGARIAVQMKQNGGWLVLDDLRGKFSFQGLTIRTRKITSGFGGDGALFNRDVLEIGLPNVVQFDNVSMNIAASSTSRPTDAGFQQTDLFSVQMQGKVTMQGNLLVFPDGNP